MNPYEEEVHRDLGLLLSQAAWATDMQVLFEWGFRDSLHVWVLSTAFEGLDQHVRSQMMWAIVRQIPPITALRITVLFTLTPNEFEEQFSERAARLEAIEKAA